MSSTASTTINVSGFKIVSVALTASATMVYGLNFSLHVAAYFNETAGANIACDVGLMVETKCATTNCLISRGRTLLVDSMLGMVQEERDIVDQQFATIASRTAAVQEQFQLIDNALSESMTQTDLTEQKATIASKIASCSSNAVRVDARVRETAGKVESVVQKSSLVASKAEELRTAASELAETKERVLTTMQERTNLKQVATQTMLDSAPAITFA